ncbi:thermonuclease family protein [Stutzerimonas frequens]|uniref:thermonuclease family protein n=1 Tax=Stutzerimonas frequens TaxID=2968969 RepID=UPI00293497C3|nr:thermonuclease family protein [Stutzerimonas frequens]WOC77653.1 thermonuclease family protein [Stutzerimonas frequens]
MMRGWLGLAFILSASAFAATTGEVISISDGDTLTLLTPTKQQIKVRLAEIDAPESRQPFGQKAKQALADLTFRKQVVADIHSTDRYGRSIARISVKGVDVNRALVESGAAWVYRAYNRDKSLLQAEAEARAAKRGLWALPESERVAPWDWRKGTKSQIAQPYAGKPVLVAATASQFSCSPRKTCGQMSSCAEARYHLEQCGNGRLDRDNDGIPCESICP